VLKDTQGKMKITKEDILDIDDLFFDGKRSAQVLTAQAANYIS